MLDKRKAIKSRQRVKSNGEVFTPKSVVNDMLSLSGINELSYDLGSRFLEPSCGDGNFLLEILLRKLSKAHLDRQQLDLDIIRAVSTIYGVDIMQDNVNEAKHRMMSCIESLYREYTNSELDKHLRLSIEYILDRNIITGNMLTKCDLDGKALVFIEWCLVGDQIQRKDYFINDLDTPITVYGAVDIYNLHSLSEVSIDEIALSKLI